MSGNAGKAWTRDELILAIGLYCKTPFGRMHNRNPDIIALAELLGRTPASIALKLGNFASIDPTLDRKGASHGSKLDKQIWDEFFRDWEGMLGQSEALLSARTTPQPLTEALQGKEVERVVKVRQNQTVFRQMVLASYGDTCCITGLKIKELLVASHIKPWADDVANRMNPANGLCLNALHDKAFDRGLMTFTEQRTVIFSRKVPRKKENAFLLDSEGAPLRLPNRFIPSDSLLRYHREHVFAA